MKYEPRLYLLTVGLFLALGFGIYWAIDGSPKKREYWARVDSVSVVSSAHIIVDKNTISLNQKDAEHVFNLLRAAPEYSPNHPAVIREGMITFKTNEGDISLQVLDTTNRGVLLWAFSSGDTGWNFGVRRCDELAPFLTDLQNIEEPIHSDR